MNKGELRFSKTFTELLNMVSNRYMNKKKNVQTYAQTKEGVYRGNSYRETDAQNMAGRTMQQLFTRWPANRKSAKSAAWVPHSSAEYSAMVIDSSLQNDEAYAIVLSENNTIIGSVSIKLDGDSDLSNWEDEGEIGVWIGKPYWKKRLRHRSLCRSSRSRFLRSGSSPKSGPAITMGTWLRENCSRVLALSRKEPKKNI